MTYTYDSELVSDLYKDAFGFRPGQYYMEAWSEASSDQKQIIWNSLIAELEASITREKESADRSVAIFESMIENTIKLGAADRDTAIRWMAQEEVFGEVQDVEHWVWGHGILFTDFGRDLVKKVCEMREISHFTY